MNKFSEEKEYSNENCLRSSHYRRKECKLYANKQERRIAFIFRHLKGKAVYWKNESLFHPRKNSIFSRISLLVP